MSRKGPSKKHVVLPDPIYGSTVVAQLINIYQAEACGCQIITVPNSILAKRKNIGRDLYEVSLDTVRGFAKDIAALGFHILP